MTLFRSLSQPKQLIGLDINSAYIKSLVLSRRHSGYKLDHYALVSLPPKSTCDSEIQQVEKVAEVLRRMQTQFGDQAHDVATAISGQSAIIKQIKMHGTLSPSDMESQAWLEASKAFPNVVNEISLDFQMLGLNSDDPTFLDVLLVACRREMIQAHIQPLLMAGFKPAVVDLLYFALARAFPLIMHQVPKNGNGQPVAMINVDPSTITMVVMHKNDVIYSRECPFDGTKLITQFTQGQGEDGWLSHSSDDGNQRLMQQLIENTASRVHYLMQLYESLNRHKPITQVILSGECATLTAAASSIEKHINIDTQIAQPFTHVTGPLVEDDTLQRLAPAFMICCGLSLHGQYHGRH